VPEKLKVYDLDILCLKHNDPISLASCADLITRQKGFAKDLHNGFRVIVSCDAIDRERFAFDAFMNQHQLASRIKPVLVPAPLHGQPDGLHLSLAGGQTVARGE